MKLITDEVWQSKQIQSIIAYSISLSHFIMKSEKQKSSFLQLIQGTWLDLRKQNIDKVP